jgi:hypothetical protein
MILYDIICKKPLLNNNSYSNKDKQNGRVKELGNLDPRDKWHPGSTPRSASLMRLQGH